MVFLAFVARALAWTCTDVRMLAPEWHAVTPLNVRPTLYMRDYQVYFPNEPERFETRQPTGEGTRLVDEQGHDVPIDVRTTRLDHGLLVEVRPRAALAPNQEYTVMSVIPDIDTTRPWRVTVFRTADAIDTVAPEPPPTMALEWRPKNEFSAKPFLAVRGGATGQDGYLRIEAGGHVQFAAVSAQKPLAWALGLMCYVGDPLPKDVEHYTITMIDLAGNVSRPVELVVPSQP